LSAVLLAMSTFLYSSHYVSDSVNSQCIPPEMLYNLQCVCVLTVKRRPAYYNNLKHVIVLSLNACSDGLVLQQLMQFD